MIARAGDSISTTLIQRVQAADSVAWEKIVRLYGPLIQYWARQSNLNDNDAADIAQEVFTTVHKRINTFTRERDGGTFRGWLRTITRFKIADLLRSRNRLPQGEGGTDALRRLNETTTPQIVEEDSAVEEAGLARRGLELIKPEFTERTWKAFLATAMENRPAEEVAAELEMSVGAVYIARSRVFKRLREELEGLL